MANESRPRTSLPPLPLPTTQLQPPPGASTEEVFQYTPLDKSIEEIRILILHPKRTNHPDEPIHCSLSHTTFGKRPIYEALSYMWGDQAVPYHGVVKVNGVPFVVGQNLGCALARLRNKGNRNIWVDAICINQMDNDEKSSQIPLMPFLYSRAWKCLVWLGGDVSDSALDDYSLKRLFSIRPNLLLPEDPNFAGPFSRSMLKTFLERMVENPYWKRVWIIQEIGSARMVEVLFGNLAIKWASFIYRLQHMDTFQDCIPLKLQSQIEDKYSDGHSLEHLIESHQSSLCQEPRDHIYGFIGLANDGQNFPIDYSKSHFQVWKDVMLFRNTNSISPQHDILSFGALMKTLLEIASIPQNEFTDDPTFHSATGARAEYHPDGSLISSDIRLQKSPGQLIIPSRIAGRIAHLGPTCSDVLAFPRLTIDWKLGINQHFDNSSRPLVREESDIFLEELESLNHDELNFAMLYDKLLSREQTMPIPNATPFPSDRAKKLPTSARRSSNLGMQYLTPSGGQRIFLLNGTKQFPEGQTSPGSIGISPPGACEGDYIRQVHGVTRAVIVRQQESNFRIIGTAVVAENLEIARHMWRNRENSTPFQRAYFDATEPLDRIDLFIDAARAYQLLD